MKSRLVAIGFLMGFMFCLLMLVTTKCSVEAQAITKGCKMDSIVIKNDTNIYKATKKPQFK